MIGSNLSVKKIEEIKRETTVEVMEIDDMHRYIGDKKTIVGYGLLLVDRVKNASISLLVTDQPKQGKHFGKKQKRKTSVW